MRVHAIHTHIIQKNESVFEVLGKAIPYLENNSIIAITSKIISLCQGCVVEKKDVSNKKKLIEQEADAYLKEDNSPYDITLTIKDKILIPSAGIDESNADNCYILYPKEVFQTAQDIWEYLRTKHGIQNLGIIITDSHTTPLRRGVTGIALGWCGFEPLHNYVGTPDLYNKPLRVTQTNVIDALATMAVFMMGEGNERTPIALIQEAPKIRFLNRPLTDEEKSAINIPLKEDIYAPILCNAEWIWTKEG